MSKQQGSGKTQTIFERLKLQFTNRDMIVEKVADTFAMVTFSYVSGMCIEIGIAGLTLSQSITSRNASIPLNLITGAPFASFRDYLQRKLYSSNKIIRLFVDLVAFLSFQIPIYVCVLLFAGANLHQIVKAVGAVIIFFLIMGPPYGMYLDVCRKGFRRIFRRKSIKADS